jgi:hypothetical protein
MQTDGIDSGKEDQFLCIATFLPLKVDFARKDFWTASIWENQDSLRSFMITEPHATAVKKFSEWSGDGSAFVEGTDRSDSINWTDALKKLQNPTYYYKKA